MRGRITAMLFLGLLAFAALAAAQDVANDTYEVRLRDGSRLYGGIATDADAAVTLRTITGVEITVPREDIVSMQRVTGFVRDGEFLPEDPNRTRLFFAPTARALPRGQVYFSTFQILLPFVQVGVTDRFSIGGGTPLLFGVDEDYRPFWITPKLQIIDRGALQAAAGAFHIVGLSGESAGIAYGAVTRSAPAASLTVGAGLAYSTDGGRSPVVMIGGDRRISRSVKLISENYILERGRGIVSGGVRFIGDHLSADVGLAIPIVVDQPVAFPIVNFVYVF